MRLIRVVAGVSIITLLLTLAACGGQPPGLISCPPGQLLSASGTHCNPTPGYPSAGPEPGTGAGTQHMTFAIPVPQQ